MRDAVLGHEFAVWVVELTNEFVGHRVRHLKAIQREQGPGGQVWTCVREKQRVRMRVRVCKKDTHTHTHTHTQTHTQGGRITRRHIRTHTHVESI